MNQKDRNGPGAAPQRMFDETYKRHAVELTLHGDRTVKTVAKELGIPGWALYEWRKLCCASLYGLWPIVVRFLQR